MTITVLVIAGLVALCCAILQGAIGFGFALAATPIMMLIFPPRQAVATVAVVSYLPLVYGVIMYRDRLALDGVAFLLPTSLVGMLLGLPVLFFAPAGLIRIIGGFASVAMAIALLISPGEPFRHERWALSAAGLAGGILQGTSGQGGPPVALALTKQHWAAPRIWGTLTTYFLAISSFFLVGLLVGGAISGTTWRVSMVLVVPVLVGAFVGNKLRMRVPAHFIRMVTLGVVALSGLSAIAGGIDGFIQPHQTLP